MKKIISTVFVLGLMTFSFHAKAQQQDLLVMKQQAEVLKLSTDLMNTKIDLEKEKQNNVKISGDVESYNKKSDNSTDDYTASDPKSTAKDAKSTAKVLKKTETANKNLEKSNNKIVDIEGEVRKLEMKLEKLKYTVEVKEK